MMNDAEMNHTPKRVTWLGSPSRKRFKRSIGDQIASPKIAWEDELTMTPKKLTMEKPNGTESSCGMPAADG